MKPGIPLGVQIVCYVVGVACLAAAIVFGWLVLVAAEEAEPGTSAVAVLLAAACGGTAAYLFVRGPTALAGREAEKRLAQNIEKRAERLGLPTEPEAYQDGGLAVAATAFDMAEAELLAAVLRTRDVPVWVASPSISTWYWHLQFATQPAGVRLLVPHGRLAEAQEIIAEGKRETSTERQAPGPEAVPAGEEVVPERDDEVDDEAYVLYRRARGLAFLLLIFPAAPVVFVLALRLLRRIRRRREEVGPTRYLRKARRLAVVAAILSAPEASFILWALIALTWEAVTSAVPAGVPGDLLQVEVSMRP